MCWVFISICIWPHKKRNNNNNELAMRSHSMHAVCEWLWEWVQHCEISQFARRQWFQTHFCFKCSLSFSVFLILFTVVDFVLDVALNAANFIAIWTTAAFVTPPMFQIQEIFCVFTFFVLFFLCCSLLICQFINMVLNIALNVCKIFTDPKGMVWHWFTLLFTMHQTVTIQLWREKKRWRITEKKEHKHTAKPNIVNMDQLSQKCYVQHYEQLVCIAAHRLDFHFVWNKQRIDYSVCGARSALHPCSIEFCSLCARFYKSVPARVSFSFRFRDRDSCVHKIVLYPTVSHILK